MLYIEVESYRSGFFVVDILRTAASVSVSNALNTVAEWAMRPTAIPGCCRCWPDMAA